MSARRIIPNGARAKPEPSNCPLLRTYDAVLHGQRVTVKVFGRPQATPPSGLRPDLGSRVPTIPEIDPEWINP